MKYLSKPHLPTQKVNTVVLAQDCPKCIVKQLSDMGLRIVFSPANPQITDATATHPDMNLLHLGDNRFVCTQSAKAYYTEMLEGAELLTPAREIHSPYPFDALLNVAILADYVFLCKKSALEHPFGKVEIAVNQGYTKCNIAVVSDNAILTEDAGIYTAALNNGIDALLIQKGGVTLNGYPHGFIGGACGKLSSDVLAITGAIRYLQDADSIRAFLRNHNVYIEALSDQQPCDIGSILPIAYF